MNNIPIAMIIEDDNQPTKNFQNYKKLLREVPNDWDVIYVSYENTGRKEYINKSKTIYKPQCGWSCSGYILNNKGAKKIITTSSKKKLGKRIKLLRSASSLNQIEFSQVLGVSQGYMSKVESGIAYPSIKSLYMINKFFKVSTDSLLDEKIQIDFSNIAKANIAKANIA